MIRLAFWGRPPHKLPVRLAICLSWASILVIAATAPDRICPPEPGAHATFARDHEYERHGTVSLLAGIDLLTGKVHALLILPNDGFGSGD